MPSEFPKIDAPGLKFRRNKDGTLRLYWCARSDLVRKGYEPETVRLHYDSDDLAVRPLIVAACQKLQAEMLEWSNGKQRDIRSFDGTIAGLVRVYQNDPSSPFQRVKYNTRRVYAEITGKIEKGVGKRALNAIGIGDIRRWYDEARKPKFPGGPERITKAHNLTRMLRRLFSFGVMIELPECERLHRIISQARFEQAPRRRERLDLHHVRSFIAIANAAGRRSLALGMALQFETGMRQKDVIGEWIPFNGAAAPGAAVLTGKLWVNGLLWSDIGPDLTIRKATTKTGAIVAHDLKLCPMTAAILQSIGEAEKSGPMIIDESAGRPYAGHAYAREWRAIAKVAGIPDSIRNMDARAGAITEAEDAGAELDEIRLAVGHTQASTTARYSRGALGKSRSVAAKRLAHRNKTEL